MVSVEIITVPAITEESLTRFTSSIFDISQARNNNAQLSNLASDNQMECVILRDSLKLLADMPRIWDGIELCFPALYNKFGGGAGKKGCYGRLVWDRQVDEIVKFYTDSSDEAAIKDTIGQLGELIVSAVRGDPQQLGKAAYAYNAIDLSVRGAIARF